MGKRAEDATVRVVMTLLVRDELDIIEANLRYHVAQGICFVIVTDNGSIDGTREILEEIAATGAIHVIDEHADNYDQARWVTRMARLAAERYDADWVINSDADEFWWPIREPSLAACLARIPREYDTAVAQRSNFLPIEDEPRPFFEHMTYRDTASLNALGEPLPPKVCHRAHGMVEVAQGNHKASWPGIRSNPYCDAIEILHFPMRSFSQFENKIAKGGAAYMRHPGPARMGSTWKHLFELRQRDELRTWYANEVLTANRRNRDLDRFVDDQRLHDYMRGLDAPDYTRWSATTTVRQSE